MEYKPDNTRVFDGVPAAELIEYTFSLIDEKKDAEIAIDELMLKMTTFFDVDIIVVKEMTERSNAIKCTYEVSKNGYVRLKGLERRFLGNAAEEWSKRYGDGGGCYRYKKSDGECPVDLTRDDAICSLVQIPLLCDDVFRGCVDFIDSSREREWSDEEVEGMKSICTVMYRYLFQLRTFGEKFASLRESLKRDALTKLPKLDEFINHINRSLVADKDMDYVIISSDIANFKYINEKYGYNTGDLLLTKFAEAVYLQYKRVVSCCREFSDIFLIALKCKKHETPENIKKLVDKCNMAFLEDIRSITEDTNIAVNSGFAFVGDNELTVSEAITGATAARKAAKEMTVLKGSRSSAFERSMIANKAKALEMISKCDGALDKREFVVFLQPKVLCDTYEIVGAEALIRWMTPDGKCIGPDDFIPAFENSGCVVKTDYFVYDAVFEYLSRRLRKGLKCVPISMNVSRVHLFNTAFIMHIDELIKKYEIPTEYIEFEITENVYLDRLPAVMFTLHWLRKMNIRISIDDFGSGYSSLDTITNLPVNTLKLDKVFMKDMLGDKEKIVINAIIDMADKLGLDVICEGVERNEQRLFLISSGCRKFQGFLFSKPVSMDEFDRMMEID